MLVQMRRFTVTEGNAHQLVEKFTTQKAPVEGRVLLIKRYYRKKCVAVKKK